MWLRYVDDVFAIWPHGDCLLEIFHQHLNGQNSSIQFTMERELEGKIAFLDVQIERQGTATLTSVFSKKTHRQIPRLQLPPPCKGAPKSCAVFEGQSGEGV